MAVGQKGGGTHRGRRCRQGRRRRDKPCWSVIGLVAITMCGLGVEVESEILTGVLAVRGYGKPRVPGVPGGRATCRVPPLPARGLRQRRFIHGE